MLDQPGHSSSAIGVLHEVLTKNRVDRDRHAKMLNDMGKVHLKVRGERDKAKAEVARLSKALEQSEAENARLAKRERELAQEVSMMAAAIDVANRELSASETMLLDTAVAVTADFKIGTVDRSQKLPEVAVDPAGIIGRSAQAAVQQPKVPMQAQLPQHRQAPKAAPADAKTTPQMPKAASLPSLGAEDNLDKSFADIEKMLSESISELRPE